jgi:glycosyltransferase involved in cell wall biosynthesis
MIEVERIPPVRIRLIPNGIPPLVPSGHDVRAELSLRDVPLIGTVCELRPEKAVDLLVDATAALRRDRLPVQLVIVGDGPEETRLRAQISARGLDAAVHLMGRRDDVPDILAALDVAVCCSDFEGTPLSVVEYMAAGLPIVATQVGGLPELVHDGENGLLVERRDASGLAAAIGKLLRDAELRRTLGETGRERQRRELGLEAMVAAFEELYLELYARSKRPR